MTLALYCCGDEGVTWHIFLNTASHQTADTMMYWNVYWIISPELACSCPMIVPPPRSHKYECQFQECFPLPGISHRTKYCSGGAIVIIPRPHYLSVCIFVTCVSGGQYLSPAFITLVSPCSRKGSLSPWLTTNHGSGCVQLTNSRTGIQLHFCWISEGYCVCTNLLLFCISEK